MSRLLCLLAVTSLVSAFATSVPSVAAGSRLILNPKPLALQTSDLPKGYRFIKGEYETNAQFVSNSHSPLITLSALKSHGQIMYYDTQFAWHGGSTTSLEDAVIAYRSSQGASWGLGTLVAFFKKAFIQSGFTAREVSVQRVGDASRGLYATLPLKKGEKQPAFGVGVLLFRRGTCLGAITLAGASPSSNTFPYALAHKIDGRIQHPPASAFQAAPGS